MIAGESCQVNVNKLFQFEVGQPGDSFEKLMCVCRLQDTVVSLTKECYTHGGKRGKCKNIK